MSHAVSQRFGCLDAIGNGLARHDVERVPLGHLLGEAIGDFRRIVVLRPRRPVAADPLLADLSRLRAGFGPFLVDHRVKLLAHPAGLRLRLDLVAVDHPATVGEGARPVAAARPYSRTVHQRTPRSRTSTRGPLVPGPPAICGPQPDAGSTGCKPPVRRQRHEAIAVGTGHGTSPEVAIRSRVVIRFSAGTHRSYSGLSQVPALRRAKLPPDLHRSCFQPRCRASTGHSRVARSEPVPRRAFRSLAMNRRQSKPNRPRTGTLPPPAVGSTTRKQRNVLAPSTRFQPLLRSAFAWRVGRRPGSSRRRFGSKPFARSRFAAAMLLLRRHRIPMNTQHMKELLPICVFRQH